VRTTLKALIPKPYDFEPTTVGEHIKKERLKRGLIQKDLAPLFKVDAFTILNWETGKTKPQIKDVPALIAFLGYDPEPPSPTTIAEHLRAKRREHGWSQRRAAAYVGVDPSTWARWESGATIMFPSHRAIAADFIGLSRREVHLMMKRQWNTAHGKPTTEST
jgi:transcriptional regulator with XRE-family HTH domain